MASRTPLPVTLAMTGAAFTEELVYPGESALEVRQRIARRLEKRALQVGLLQSGTSGTRNVEDHELLVDEPVQVILRNFPTVTLRHNETYRKEVYFRASRDATEWMAYIETPCNVQLLERDPREPWRTRGMALIRYEGNTERGLPEEVYVRQAHITEVVESHVECQRAPAVNVPDGAILVRIQNSDGRPDVIFHKDEEAAKAHEAPHGYLPSGCTVVSVSGCQDLNGESRWCEVQWQGDSVWVWHAHVLEMQPSESAHNGTVCISHAAGRGDVVYHSTLEAAEAKRAPHGKIPSGSLSTVLLWDMRRGAGGWAKLTWRGAEVFVKQAHVRIAQDQGIQEEG